VATVMVWKSFGFHLVLFIAGLQQIPDQANQATIFKESGALL